MSPEPAKPEPEMKALISITERLFMELGNLCDILQRYNPYIRYTRTDGSVEVMDMRMYRKVRVSPQGKVSLYPHGGGQNENLGAHESEQVVAILNQFSPPTIAEKKARKAG